MPVVPPSPNALLEPPTSNSRIPNPCYRHAAPSGPWPWVDDADLADALKDLDTQSAPSVIVPFAPCSHENCQDCSAWNLYPQSLFGNWTPKQVHKCKIGDVLCTQLGPSVVRYVNVMDSGMFGGFGEYVVTARNQRDFWRNVVKLERQPGIFVRALFVENMSGPVLQMLGTRYEIEPFFFSSALNWTPSRYRENLQPNKGDQITITLTFPRKMTNTSLNCSDSSTLTVSPLKCRPLSQFFGSPLEAWKDVANDFAQDQMIDTRAPLILKTGNNTKTLLLDQLAIHMVRGPENTIISYHPYDQLHRGSAKALHARLRLVGKSVYWQSIFNQMNDPTFVLLAILWHALYSWDETFETLYEHFCWLESRAIITNDMVLTQELHILCAHVLQYTSLLSDFQKSVVFIRDTPNPAMDSGSLDDDEQLFRCRERLKDECEALLSEIERLQRSRSMLDSRLKNVMGLVFAFVNIKDSKAIKRLSYLTMIFLPASFVATAFGMQIKELVPDTKATLSLYVQTALPLTVSTIWIIVMFQSKFHLVNPEASVWRRLLWPLILFISLFKRRLLDLP